jgi:hypothetical protein
MNLFTVAKGSTPGGVRVRGRELVGSIRASGAVAAGSFSQLQVGSTGAGTAFELRPGAFPRLAGYNGMYEMYKFHRANVTFQANSPTTAKGVIIAAADYDAADSAPTTAVGMMRNISATMSNLYSDCGMAIKGDLSRLPKYLTNVLSASTDSVQSLQAKIFLAVDGADALVDNQSVGYLIIEYDVEFFTPQ